MSRKTIGLGIRAALDDKINDFIADSDDTDYSDAEPEARESSAEENDVEAALDSDEPFECSEDEGDEHQYLSKDESILWTSRVPLSSKTRAANVVTEPPGVKGVAKGAKTPTECWELFFPTEILEDLVQHTNEKLLCFRHKYKRDSDCLPTDLTEMRAFLGLLYISGQLNLAHVEVHDLWRTNGLSPECFRATMKENRFRLLLRALRFDDAETRVERRESDKLAPIREIWDEFNKRCVDFYSPGENVTIDEMMAAFRGRCSFKQFIPSKPDKYGLKIFAMVDSETLYTSSMELYVGQQASAERQVSNKPHDVVKRVCSSILDTGRNITMDNWFTSIPLVIDLYENCRTTVVGTLRQNKREVPPGFVSIKNREPCTSLFGFYRNMTLVSYVSQSKSKKKCALLVSSMHKCRDLDPATGDLKKPKVITYYNSTKGAVDLVDQMRAKYNVARASRRWPLTLFFAVMNVALINSLVIYNHNTRDTVGRREFIETLAFDLIKPWVTERLKKPSISLELRHIMKKFIAAMPHQSDEDDEDNEIHEGLCAYCPRRKNKKTKSKCFECCKSICGEHTVKMCNICHDKLQATQDAYEQ